MQVLYIAFYLQYNIGYHKHNRVQRILLHLLYGGHSMIFLCFPSPQFLCRHLGLPEWLHVFRKLMYAVNIPPENQVRSSLLKYKYEFNSLVVRNLKFGYIKPPNCLCKELQFFKFSICIKYIIHSCYQSNYFGLYSSSIWILGLRTTCWCPKVCFHHSYLWKKVALKRNLGLSTTWENTLIHKKGLVNC